MEKNLGLCPKYENQDAKNLNNLPLQELRGSLIIYELVMKQHNDKEVKRKRKIALKSMVEKEEDEDSLKEEDGDEDMALIIKKFKKFLRRKK